MILILHISVALLGIAQATYALFAPSQRKLQVVYGLLAATLASGTYLVWQSHASILSACMSGLLYTGAVSALSAGAQYRLAKAKVRI
jgi:hypothetical protein